MNTSVAHFINNIYHYYDETYKNNFGGKELFGLSVQGDVLHQGRGKVSSKKEVSGHTVSHGQEAEMNAGARFVFPFSFSLGHQLMG